MCYAYTRVRTREEGELCEKKKSKATCATVSVGSAEKHTSSSAPATTVCLTDWCACPAVKQLKAPGKAPRPIQIHQIGMLKQLGFRVEVIDSKEQVDEFVKELSGNAVSPA